jgi:hypothetical protein
MALFGWVGKVSREPPLGDEMDVLPPHRVAKASEAQREPESLIERNRDFVYLALIT